MTAHGSARFRTATWSVSAIALLIATGCKKEELTTEEACQEVQSHLEQSAWPTVLGTNCADCHTPGGPAPANGSDFVLLPPGYPNFQQRNLEAIAETAAYEVDDVSILLRKPLGELNHGGGAKIKKGTAEYESLETLVELVSGSNSCASAAAEADHDDVDLLGAQASFRKASLHLAYRLPTADENKRLNDEGESALPGLVDGLMNEDAFYERLKDIFNDQFLTRRYMAYVGYGPNLLDDRMYPESDEPWDALEDDEIRRKINTGIAEEPLDYVAYLVKNNKPFTDLVAGDYMVVNPFTAPYFNANIEFQDPNNENEWVESPRQGIVRISNDVYEMRPLPSAGVMTSPVFLNRFPTTDTNRNRHRARMILDFFLGTDILKVGDRPLDPTQAGLYPNPTQNDPSCASCHQILDPIAGAFQKYSDNDAERYEPNRSWYGEMLAAGFGREQMPTGDIDTAPNWLGQRIAADPRFPFAMVKIVYEGLMGREPVAHPEDFDDPNYSAHFTAWRDQEALFQEIGAKFVDSEYNLRTIVRELILSPFYRAYGVASEPDEWRSLELGGLGTARLSTPMLLSRKIEATTGLRWTRSWDRTEYLMSDYRILYGGIDSDTVNKRLTVPNGVMASVAWRMANELACTVTTWDFWLPEEERKLMVHVSLDDAPKSPEGDATPEAVARIKKNIAYLYERFLGRTVEVDSSQVSELYELFSETWTEGQVLIETDDNGVGNGLNYRCQTRNDLRTGEELAEDARLTQDPTYTIRAWRAVITYLLSDYEFLYE